MQRRQGLHAVARHREFRPRGFVAQAVGLQAEQRGDDLQVVLHAMVDLGHQQVALLQRRRQGLLAVLQGGRGGCQCPVEVAHLHRHVAARLRHIGPARHPGPHAGGEAAQRARHADLDTEKDRPQAGHQEGRELDQPLPQHHARGSVDAFDRHADQQAKPGLQFLDRPRMGGAVARRPLDGPVAMAEQLGQAVRRGQGARRGRSERERRAVLVEQPDMMAPHHGRLAFGSQEEIQEQAAADHGPQGAIGTEDRRRTRQHGAAGDDADGEFAQGEGACGLHKRHIVELGVALAARGRQATAQQHAVAIEQPEVGVAVAASGRAIRRAPHRRLRAPAPAGRHWRRVRSGSPSAPRPRCRVALPRLRAAGSHRAVPVPALTGRRSRHCCRRVRRSESWRPRRA